MQACENAAGLVPFHLLGNDKRGHVGGKLLEHMPHESGFAAAVRPAHAHVVGVTQR